MKIQLIHFGRTGRHCLMFWKEGSCHQLKLGCPWNQSKVPLLMILLAFHLTSLINLAESPPTSRESSAESSPDADSDSDSDSDSEDDPDIEDTSGLVLDAEIRGITFSTS